MARKKSAGGNAVTLFPFLAVLVCVMGSLIFLLLATTKRMHDRAVLERQAELAADVPIPPQLAVVEPSSAVFNHPHADLGGIVENPTREQETAADAARTAREREQARLVDETTRRIADLEQRRTELQGELKRQRSLQQSAQKYIDSLQTSVGEAETRLRGTLAELKSEGNENRHTEEIAALEAKIIELRRKLRLLQNRPAEGESKYVMIPFDARSGTTRRPILIECTDAGLRFLPEDVVVRPSDLEGFNERYNPLAAGAAALIDYWTVQNSKLPQSDQEPEPYVLLIVRPSGTVGYYVAMKMLSGLKQPFGYELVDDAVKLQLQPVDPEARRICQDAVAGRVSEREQIAGRVGDGFRSGRGTKRGEAGKSESFEVADVVPPEQGTEERSWENIERFEGRRPNGKPAPERSIENARPAKPVAAKPVKLDSASQQQADPAPAGGKPESNPPRELAELPEEMPPTASPRDRQAGGRVPQSQIKLEQLSRRHWGKSEPTATIGVEQDVTIRVDGQRIVVAEDRMIRQLPGEASLDLFLRVMEAVDAESGTWGKPRPGFYWTPRLRFVISPGGNQVFERIDPLAIRSGLSTTREFTLEGVSPAASEEPR